MTIPPIERIRLQKAAVDEGFGIARPDDGDWLVVEGLGTPGILRLTFAGSHYIAATSHGGVAAELGGSWTGTAPGGMPALPHGYAAFEAVDTSALHRLVRDIRRLARALPREPLRLFEAQMAAELGATEVKRLVAQRVGQDIFRDALMEYWDGSCAVTGVAEPQLLRASHIKPWARCESDAERLDVHNGLLLAAHLDAAFDAGLISFADYGAILFSPNFSEANRVALGLHPGLALRKASAGHRANLAWHRRYILQPVATDVPADGAA